MFVGNIRIPNRALRIDTDAIGSAIVQISPHPTVRQTAISSDVEGREFLGIGLSDDEGRVIGRDGHAIREGDSIRYLTSRAVRRDKRDDSGGERLPVRKLKTAAVDVRITTTIDDDLVPSFVRKAGQIRI